ncbi:MAG: HAD family hydrolase [Bacillota bacterium]
MGKSKQKLDEALTTSENVLLDLDGTLLPLDIDEFLQDYFAAVQHHFSDLIEQKKFMQALLQATEIMLKNDGSATNKEAFAREFFSCLPELDEDETFARFEDFYRNEFPALGANIRLDDEVITAVERLSEQKKNLVLATNPLFPEEAIEARLEWIGISPESFDLITTYSNMHYSKPKLEYYKQILDRLEIKAENTIMVGNDVNEDLVAGKLGITTILLTDYLKKDEEKPSYEPDWQGSRQEFFAEVKKLEQNNT